LLVYLLPGYIPIAYTLVCTFLSILGYTDFEWLTLCWPHSAVPRTCYALFIVTLRTVTIPVIHCSITVMIYSSHYCHLIHSGILPLLRYVWWPTLAVETVLCAVILYYLKPVPIDTGACSTCWYHRYVLFKLTWYRLTDFGIVIAHSATDTFCQYRYAVFLEGGMTDIVAITTALAWPLHSFIFVVILRWLFTDTEFHWFLITICDVLFPFALWSLLYWWLHSLLNCYRYCCASIPGIRCWLTFDDWLLWAVLLFGTFCCSVVLFGTIFLTCWWWWIQWWRLWRILIGVLLERRTLLILTVCGLRYAGNC